MKQEERERNLLDPEATPTWKVIYELCKGSGPCHMDLGAVCPHVPLLDGAQSSTLHIEEAVFLLFWCEGKKER